jgi:hypothetical protein
MKTVAILLMRTVVSVIHVHRSQLLVVDVRYVTILPSFQPIIIRLFTEIFIVCTLWIVDN